ncbi:MAG TPA: DedA family protein [Candidatus Aquilonibacter sp.]|nr:DedA family protein [Candidatus Aquilonibacter sp.]
MGHLQDAIVALVDHYGYGGLLIVMALGNIGAPIGSEVVLPLSGALTATGHLASLWLTILVTVIGELLGGTVGYAVGRYGGRPLIDRYGKFVHLTHENLNRVHAFFERYGSFAIFICRFVPVIRGIVSIPAGLAEMDLAQFYMWYALGSLAFCGALVYLGYVAGDHIDAITPMLHKGGLLIAAGAVVVMIALWLILRRRQARATDPS